MAVVRLQGESEKLRGIYYQVESSSTPIGAGGMGQVFQGLCVNEITGATRPVAIKFMFDDLPPQAIERARREASIQLHNDNLIEMLGFIETCEKSPFGKEIKRYHVVSELLSGVSLDDLLKGKTTDQYGQENAFAVNLLQEFRTAPEHFAKKIVASVLSGLMALHDAGFIHRDIDPTNIMITDDGRIKLIDLGLARQLTHTEEKNLTIEGKFLGKPEYAAPELVIGDFHHQNPTTDIYSVGILLYQCLTGNAPYQGPRHEIMEQQLHTKLNLSPIENKDLRAIIAKATEKKQASRYKTCYEMRVALDSVKNKEQTAQTSKKYFPVLIAAILILGIAAFWIMNRHDSATELPQSGGSETQSTVTVVDAPNQSPVVEEPHQASDNNQEPEKNNKEVEKPEKKDQQDKSDRQEKISEPAAKASTSTVDYSKLSDYDLEVKSRNDVNAQYELGKRLINRGRPNTLIRGIILLKDAARKGHSQAQELLNKTVSVLERKAANGDSIATHILSSI